MRIKWSIEDDKLVYKLWKTNNYSYKYTIQELKDLLKKYKIKRSTNALKIRMFHYHYIYHKLNTKWKLPKQCIEVYNDLNK